MEFAEISRFTVCMTKTSYGFGQKEKPALLAFRLERGLAFRGESVGTYHGRPCDLRS